MLLAEALPLTATQTIGQTWLNKLLKLTAAQSLLVKGQGMMMYLG